MSRGRRRRPPRDAGGGLGPAFAAARARLGLIALLLALAAVAWWSTADRMAGMDEGPGTDLGALGWFIGVWVVMMAAMMFPSVAPTVALYARMSRGARRPRRCLHRRLPADVDGRRPGRLRRSSTPAARCSATRSRGTARAAGSRAARCWSRPPTSSRRSRTSACRTCRSPLGFLLGSWRDGRAGALRWAPATAPGASAAAGR